MLALLPAVLTPPPPIERTPLSARSETLGRAPDRVARRDRIGANA
jgi:hypothetical protein